MSVLYSLKKRQYKSAHTAGALRATQAFTGLHSLWNGRGKRFPLQDSHRLQEDQLPQPQTGTGSVMDRRLPVWDGSADGVSNLRLLELSPVSVPNGEKENFSYPNHFTEGTDTAVVSGLHLRKIFMNLTMLGTMSSYQ